MGKILVPREPTKEMLQAGADMFDSVLNSSADFKHHAWHIYQAMLAAAPPEQNGEVPAMACSRCGKIGAALDDGHACITIMGGPTWSGLAVAPEQNAAATQVAQGSNGADAIPESEPAPAAAPVSYGPEKQDYPGGPIYRVGTSTKITEPVSVGGGYIPPDQPENILTAAPPEPSITDTHDPKTDVLNKYRDKLDPKTFALFEKLAGSESLMHPEPNASKLPLSRNTIHACRLCGIPNELCDQALAALRIPELEREVEALKHDIARATERNTQLLAEKEQAEAALATARAQERERLLILRAFVERFIITQSDQGFIKDAFFDEVDKAIRALTKEQGK